MNSSNLSYLNSKKMTLHWFLYLSKLTLSNYTQILICPNNPKKTKKIIQYTKSLFSVTAFTLLTSTAILSLLTNDIMIIWFIMEINNFILLSLLCLNMKNKKMLFLYFFSQILASLVLILSILYSPTNLNNYPFISTLIMGSLILKLSLPPFHPWLLSIISFMDWNMIIMILSIQKIIPFVIFSMFNFHSLIYLIIIFLSLSLPPFMMLNLTNFKKLMAYSSINQSGWLLYLIFLSHLTWLIYLFFYTFIMFFTFNLFKIFKITMFNSSKLNNLTLTMIFMLTMMNLSGLPPLSFFSLKWYSMFMFSMYFKFNIIITTMLVSSLFMMFTYINMMMKLNSTFQASEKLLNPLLPYFKLPLNLLTWTTTFLISSLILIF